MVFISKRRFRDEVERRVCQEMDKHAEREYRHRKERELEKRLIEVEKKVGIEHPSHRADFII